MEETKTGNESRVVNRDAVLGREYIGKHPDDPVAYRDVLAIYREHMGKDDERVYHQENRWLRKQMGLANQRIGSAGVVPTLFGSTDTVRKLERMNEVYRQSLLMDAQVDFDAYCRYIEADREPRKQFYLPRRKKLAPVVNAMQRLMDDQLDLLGISLPPGVGKLLADDTPVMTSRGWKKHGNLKVGDYVVGLDGEYKRVERVFEKNVADYEVEFTNGEVIKCHGNHEWLVWNRHRNKEEILTTKHMAESVMETGTPGKRGHRYIYQLPYAESMKGEELELPVDPYLIGAWLGDGTSNKPAVTICDTDTEIVDEYQKHYQLTAVYPQIGCKRYEFETAFRKDLQKVGMCRTHRQSNVKYIPAMYYRASETQRMELLAGLIDTDGVKDRDGRYSISTTNEYILDGVRKLVSSFGWRLTVTETEPMTSTSGIVGKKRVYCIMFCPDKKIPCRVERKKQHKLAVRRRISIKAIRKIDPVPGNCIQVEGGIYLAGETMLPTHNSTLSIFYLTWVAGKYPDEPNLTGSHSNAFVKGAYEECLRILDPNGEYLWKDVFPGLGVTNTNAKDCRIDIGNRKRFETLEFTSIGSGNAGLYRASRLLYCDDLISGIEIALSKERLDKLWETYTTDLRQRKIGNHCKELHVATRWSVHDVLGRLERQYEGSDRVEFIALPALNENDESNFDYPYGVGFSTEFYHEQRDIMDDANWKALYQNEPIEREGQLYHPDELRRYFDLPDTEPDGIVAVCDTKAKGSDYAFMPIMYLYGQDVYIGDCVCDNGDPGIVEERLARMLADRKVQQAQFESNSAGWHVAEKIQNRVYELGGKTKITTKPTTANKETKIVVNAPEVKRRCLFLDSSRYKANSDYGRMMSFLTSYTMAGKNKHDDVPDGMAMAVMYLENMVMQKAKPMARPF